MQRDGSRPLDSQISIYRADAFWISYDQRAEAIACQNGQVLAVGSTTDLTDRYPGATVHEVGGFAIPGINDAHSHPALVASTIASPDVSPTSVTSNESLLKKIASALSRSEPGRWIVATGYDPNGLSDTQRIHRKDLDRIAPQTPVVLIHMSAHWGVLNSAALRQVNITSGSPDPIGGYYGRDATGALDGSVWERPFFELAYGALGRGEAQIPQPSPWEMAKGLETVQDELIAAGITSITDAIIGSTEVEAYLQLERDGKLKLRTTLLITHESIDDVISTYHEAIDASEMINIGGVKLFIDGAVSGGTCMLRDPQPGHIGVSLMSPQELLETVRDLHFDGYQVAAHANGDWAIAAYLEALDALGASVLGRRHRIEHCSIVDPDLVLRLRHLGIVAVPFGNYATFHGDKLLSWYGTEAAERMFAHRWLLDEGVSVAGSSDYPCGPFEFGLALHSCVNRLSSSGAPFGTSQSISVDETIDMYTRGSAYASFDEEFKGCLYPGYLADFVVLDRDPDAVDNLELKDIMVVDTFIGGESAT